jgi:hypothetical protein
MRLPAHDSYLHQKMGCATHPKVDDIRAGNV